MKTLVTNIIAGDSTGIFLVTVEFGDEEAKDYRVYCDLEDPDCKAWTLEEELFMRLSDLAAKRFCNCAIYQFELGSIIEAFINQEEIPAFPIELGTTSFGLSRPSRIKIVWDRLRSPFMHLYYWWKFRHIRRENLASEE